MWKKLSPEIPKTFGERLKWAREELKLKVKEVIIPQLKKAGLSVSANRWYEWEKIETPKDSRSRKLRLKEKKAQGLADSQKRETGYYPPWPDELDTIEQVLGIRHGWLINGEDRPFSFMKNSRATDNDPLYSRLSSDYQSFTEEQQNAINQIYKSFRIANQHSDD